MKNSKAKYRVTQSNSLIMAPRKKQMSIQEMKLFSMMITTVQPNDKEFEIQRISVVEFSKIMNLNETDYKHIRRVLKKISENSVEIIEDDGPLYVPFFSRIKYFDGKGIIEFKFSDDIKHYLLQLHKEFTSYKLSAIASMKSTYSFRIYELAKKWEGIGKFVYELEKLRQLIGATQKSYDLFGSFKQRALKPALEEINENPNCDITISFEEIKVGKKVTELAFTVKSKSSNPKINKNNKE